MKEGPIILIEDDSDDQEIFRDIVKELGTPNELIIFDNCPEALKFLETTLEQPFIIFCDVNMPMQSGLEFKKQIDANPELRKKSIPFVFYSTSVSQEMVNEAYTEMTVQGFFQKKANFQEIKSNIKLILEYWKACKHPNTM